MVMPITNGVINMDRILTDLEGYWYPSSLTQSNLKHFSIERVVWIRYNRATLDIRPWREGFLLAAFQLGSYLSYSMAAR